jgi:uncharacterized membrane protein SpoIIM required for sporulation
MREPAFLRKNKEKWLKFESEVFGENQVKTLSPDQIANLYQELIDDLAYARTFYPKSQTTRYINGLAARTHLLIYKNRKDDRNRFMLFWTEELPLVVHRAHKYIFFSLVLFLLAFAIGWISAQKQDSFFREAMGYSYANMTEEHISQDNPTRVYQYEEPFPMFVRIAFNNVFVMLATYAAGLFFSIGCIVGLPFLGKGMITGVFPFGVIVGAFLGNFFAQGVGAAAIPVVMIHGTLELSAIIITGGAGLMLGNSLLFPGTWSRKVSVTRAAREGGKIMLGLFPVIVFAAFLEGYVTRHYDMGMAYIYLIVLLSAAFIIGYFGIFPVLVARKVQVRKQQEAEAGRHSLSHA